MPGDDSRLLGFQRGGASTEAFRYLRSNSEQELLTAQGLPPYTELSRRGRGWSAMTTAAVAGLVVRPDTVAKFTLWNGETGPTARSYVIDRVWAFNLVTTAAISGYSIWACVHPAGMAAVTADITAINSMNGGSAYTGSARLDVGATVADDGWFPLNTGTLTGGVTTAPSGAQVVDVGGRFIVQPTGGFSIQVVSTIVGLTFTTGLSWYEVLLDNE
jgi:hypothetical protein